MLSTWQSIGSIKLHTVHPWLGHVSLHLIRLARGLSASISVLAKVD